MNLSVRGLVRACLVTTTLVGVASCGGGGYGGGGGGGGNPPGSTTYTLGGTVTGLAGTGLSIQNGTAKLAITGNQAFTFPDKLANGTAYNVTVDVQPISPPQDCKVTNGAGTVGSSNVTNVTITCTTVAAGLTLNNSTPASGVSGVSRTVEPALTFSSALNAATATASSVSLRSASGEQAITPTVAGNVLTVKSTRTLLPLTPYTLTVNSGLRNTAGFPLADPTTVNFTTADGVWQASRPIQKVLAEAFVSDIAFSANGDAMAVWEQIEGEGAVVWGSRYVVGQGWLEAKQIDTAEGDNAQTEFDANGVPFAVWTADPLNNGTQEVWTAHLDSVTGEWVGRVRLDDPRLHTIESLQLARSSNGDAFVVWAEFTQSTAKDIRVNRFVSGDWQGPEPLEQGDKDAHFPLIAADANGGAVAVWAQVETDGGVDRLRVLASRYVRGGTWSPPEPIDAGMPVPNFVELAVAIDATGNAIAVFSATGPNPTGPDIRTSLYATRTVGTAWEMPQRIDRDDEDNSRGVQLKMNARGEAVVLFIQGGNDFGGHAISNYYTPVDGWIGAQSIDSEESTAAFGSTVAIDASGNALAVLPQEKNGTRNAQPFRYNPHDNAWTSGAPLNTNGIAETTAIATNAEGSALAIWSELTGTPFNLRAALFE